MPRIYFLLQIVFILLAIATAAGARSPEVGIVGLLDFTNNTYLEYPRGLGLYLFQPVSQKVKLTLEFDYLTCKSNDKACDYERSATVYLINSNKIYTIETGLRHVISHSRSTFLEFGGGLCLSVIRATRRLAHSGELWSPDDAAKLGIVIDIGLLVVEPKDLPLTTRFGFRHRFLEGWKGTHIPESHRIFVNPIIATEVSFAIGFQFGQ